MHMLDSPRLKLSRAEEHFTNLKVEIEKFLVSRPYSFIMQPDPQPPKFVLCGKIHRDPPIEWSCLVGDFANNARSVLDYLVFQLSDLQPTDDRRHRLYFPIFDSSDEYARKERRYLAGVKTEYKNMIERYQPYQRRDEPKEDPLGLLRRINDGDKHRDINMVGALANLNYLVLDGSSGLPDWIHLEQGASIRVGETFDVGNGFTGRKIGNGAVTKDGDVVAKLTISKPGKMKVNPDFAVTVLFSEGDTAIQGHPVLDTLASILARVRELIHEFEVILNK